MEKKLVLVICKGNIQRSPIAEQCIKKVFLKKGLDNRVTVVSRGIQGAFGTKKAEGKI